jgi:Tol biopolymer transport system component
VRDRDVSITALAADPVNGRPTRSVFPAINATGRWCVFQQFGVPGPDEQVAIRDFQSGVVQRLYQGTSPSISANGQFVAFSSFASNLVPGDMNDDYDLFLLDRAAGTIERVDLTSSGGEVKPAGGSPPPSISADGRFIAFGTYASLVPADTNNAWDTYVRDRVSATTDRVSVTNDGSQALEPSGSFYDWALDISSDGRFVSFTSRAGNLTSQTLSETPRGYVRDRQRGITELVAIDVTGHPSVHRSAISGMSPDGRYVAFVSYAPDLVPNDTNGKADVFVRDRALGTTERVNVANDGAESNRDDGLVGGAVSADGRYVAFRSFDSTLVNDDTNSEGDVFIRDRGATPAG